MPVSLAIWCRRCERISKVIGSTLLTGLAVVICSASCGDDDVAELVPHPAIPRRFDDCGPPSLDHPRAGNLTTSFKTVEIVHIRRHEFAVVFEINFSFA